MTDELLYHYKKVRHLAVSHLRCTLRTCHVQPVSIRLTLPPRLFCLSSKGLSTILCMSTGEAARLQQLEVQLLGESSTGFKVEAAQQSPGSS